MNYAFTPHAISCLAVTLSAQDIQKEAWDRVPPYADSLFKTHLDFNNDAAWTLRLGGHARTMLEAYRNPDFGFSEIKQDAWVHHRVQTFAAVERGRNFTLAAEVTWGEMEGRKPPLSPVDEDQLDLLQLEQDVKHFTTVQAACWPFAKEQISAYRRMHCVSHGGRMTGT